MTEEERREDLREKIDHLHKMVRHIQSEIHHIAKKELGTMDVVFIEVSDFWKCNISPIGWCIYRAVPFSSKSRCLFCDDKSERTPNESEGSAKE